VARRAVRPPIRPFRRRRRSLPYQPHRCQPPGTSSTSPNLRPVSDSGADPRAVAHQAPADEVTVNHAGCPAAGASRFALLGFSREEGKQFTGYPSCLGPGRVAIEGVFVPERVVGRTIKHSVQPCQFGDDFIREPNTRSLLGVLQGQHGVGEVVGQLVGEDDEFR
jgi:hypothetical protein